MDLLLFILLGDLCILQSKDCRVTSLKKFRPIKKEKEIRWEIKVSTENSQGIYWSGNYVGGKNLSYAIKRKWEFLWEKVGFEEDGASEGSHETQGRQQSEVFHDNE